MAKKDIKGDVNGASELNNGFDLNADDAVSGSTHLNEPVAEESELEKAKEELKEAKDKHLRLVAEFDNFRKRNAKERIELMQTAGRDVISGLLEIMDDIDRAQQQWPGNEDVEQLKEGVSLIFNKLKSQLQAKGLRPMESVGKDFNTDLHEAVAESPAPSAELKDKVIHEVVKGYYLNDKIIRHAKVVVGK